MSVHSVSIDEAYRACQRLARAHYENFPVASWLVPKAMRPHVAAVYAFARVADDFADEGTRSAFERLELLDGWRRRLTSSAARAPSHPDAEAIFTAVRHTIERHDLDETLFTDLISAFEQDVSVARYRDWDALLDYCRRSANPVGRLVLQLAGQRSAEAAARSDAVCTALQLTNFWQDFGRDWAGGRLYVPEEVLAGCGASEDDVRRNRLTAEWQRVFTDVVGRTAAMFDRGRGVTEDVSGRLRYELRATWLGGTTTLQRTAVLRQTSFTARPVLGALDVLRIARGALVWR